MAETERPGLIADIGGTNARFALVYPGAEPHHPLVLSCADYAGPAEAALAYLNRIAPGQRPGRAAFAIAGPVGGDMISMTNHVWRFSIAETRERIGADSLEVVNDFTAVALSVPLLRSEHLVSVGGGPAVARTPIAVLGPGTGLGVSALVPCGEGFTALATEGGHATMAPADERQSQVLLWLRGLYDHVSAERVLSGPGLVNIYTALCELDGKEPEPLSPAAISTRARDGTSHVCRDALEMFFAMLGTVAGNVALTLGARQGVYIAGGIVPRMTDLFLQSRFRQCFDAKGRFRSYMAAIPVNVVVHPYAAFVGLSGLVRPTSTG